MSNIREIIENIDFEFITIKPRMIGETLSNNGYVQMDKKTIDKAESQINKIIEDKDKRIEYLKGKYKIYETARVKYNKNCNEFISKLQSENEKLKAENKELKLLKRGKCE